MSVRDTLEQLLQSLPEERVRQVLEFAESLQSQDAQGWRQFGQAQLARAYGPGEPDYSLADLKPEPTS